MTSFLFGLLYFAPIIVGLLRRSGNLPMLFLLNVLLGWTVVGWLFSCKQPLLLGGGIGAAAVAMSRPGGAPW